MKDARRYEQCIRVFTVFFSALIGFGLNRILNFPAFGNDTWICFLLALLLFLRFLFGSANHLWLEYVKAPPDGSVRNFILWDLLWVTAFGFFGLRICYSSSVSEFLGWNIIFGIAAAVDSPAEAGLRWLFSAKPGKWWMLWAPVNIVHALAAYLAFRCYSESAQLPTLFGATSPVVYLACVFTVLLLIDVAGQLAALDV